MRLLSFVRDVRLCGLVRVVWVFRALTCFPYQREWNRVTDLSLHFRRGIVSGGHREKLTRAISVIRVIGSGESVGEVGVCGERERESGVFVCVCVWQLGEERGH